MRWVSIARDYAAAWEVKYKRAAIFRILILVDDPLRPVVNSAAASRIQEGRFVVVVAPWLGRGRKAGCTGRHGRESAIWAVKVPPRFVAVQRKTAGIVRAWNAEGLSRSLSSGLRPATSRSG